MCVESSASSPRAVGPKARLRDEKWVRSGLAFSLTLEKEAFGHISMSSWLFWTL